MPGLSPETSVLPIAFSEQDNTYSSRQSDTLLNNPNRWLAEHGRTTCAMMIAQSRARQSESSHRGRVMPQGKPLLPNISSPFQRYGLALLSVAIALGTALLLEHYHFRGVEFPLFLFAIALTVWYAGIGPAILAVVLSSLAFDYFFTEPLYSFAVTRSDLPYFIVFVLFASLLACSALSATAPSRSFCDPATNLSRKWRCEPSRPACSISHMTRFSSVT